VHVLAASAWAILTGVGSGEAVPTSRRQLFSTLKAEYVEPMLEMVDEPFNFMKHGARDTDATLRFTPFLAEQILFFCCVDFMQIFKEANLELNLFMAYSLRKHPELFLPTAAASFGAIAETAIELAGSFTLDVEALRRLIAQYDELEAAGHLA
jgi:hypothetical protein